MEKRLQPMFLPKSDKKDFDEEMLERMSACGVEVFFVQNPHLITQGVPVAPIVLPNDTITKCLLAAVNNYKPSRERFGDLMLEELRKQ